MSTLGETLRAARQAKGSTLDQIETATRIRKRHLLAMEAEDWPSLPDALYVKGFLRTYARYLGVPAEQVLSLYDQQQKQPPAQADVRQAIRPLDAPSRLWSGLLVGLVVFLTFAAVLAYLYRQYAATELPPTPVIILDVPTPAPTLVPTRLPLLEITVPDLVGKEFSLVEQDLRALGLKVEVTDRRYDNTWFAGRIITQSVPAGLRLRLGETVGVVLSRGREGVSVPNVVNIPFSQANGILTNAGFKTERQDAPSSQAPAGVVFRQEPAPLSAAQAGSTVVVYVSQGAAVSGKVTLPNVVGKSWDEAKKIMAAAGLSIRSVNMQGVEGVPSPPPPGYVLSTSPAPGTQVDPGSSVDIAVRKQE